METKYYVYAYLDTNKPGKYIYENLIFDHEPFYIGKGYGKRLYSHLALRGKNYLKKKIIKSLLNSNQLPIIQKIYTGLKNEEAMLLEIELIKKIGRIQNNTGPLSNMTDGGEGHSGLIQSEETKQKRKESRDKSTFWETVKSDLFKQKMSKITTDRYEDEKERQKMSESKVGEKNPMFGKTTSEKQKQAVKNAHKNGKIKLTDIGRKKLIENGKKRKGTKNIKIHNNCIVYLVVSPDNIVYRVLGAKNLQNFCSIYKIQYHLLKQNIGTIITKEILKNNGKTAQNTIMWKVDYEKK